MEWERKKWDVIVIGGGPAGMMAAGRAAECGASVLLLEKNESLGKKLLITGGGRCNVTNAEPDKRKLLEKFKGSTKFLFSPFARFGVDETLEFFEKRNMPTKIEEGNRVFPRSDRSQSVLDVLVQYMKEGGVRVRSNIAVKGLIADGKKVVGVKALDNEVIQAESVIIATGGKSHPETGSTGDGFRWLSEIGHTVIEPDPALVPVVIREKWVKRLSGVGLDDVKLSIFQKGEKRFSRRGRMLFTHFGLSGPLVLNMSKDINELLKYGEVNLFADVFPGVNRDELDGKVLEVFEANKNKQIKNIIGLIFVPSVAAEALGLSGIDPEKSVHSISREERLILVDLLKKLPMSVSGILGAEKAIVTSGGVSLEEVDFRKMQSRLYPNLYCAGDILNIDRPSGGFSLQLCWTTGYVAGTSAAESQE